MFQFLFKNKPSEEIQLSNHRQGTALYGTVQGQLSINDLYTRKQMIKKFRNLVYNNYNKKTISAKGLGNRLLKGLKKMSKELK